MDHAFHPIMKILKVNRDDWMLEGLEGILYRLYALGRRVTGDAWTKSQPHFTSSIFFPQTYYGI